MAQFGQAVRVKVAVLLAAGAGSRFTGSTHKLLAQIGGARVVDRAVGAVLAAIDSGAPIDAVIVVTGAVPLAFDDPRVRTVHNPAWADGQATSLQAGIDEARDLGAEAVVVGLADQPFVDPSAWTAVASSTSPIAVAQYADDATTRTPALLRRETWGLLPTTGDFGARHLVSSRPELVEQVPCSGSPADIDTPEDLAKWNP